MLAKTLSVNKKFKYKIFIFSDVAESEETTTELPIFTPSEHEPESSESEYANISNETLPIFNSSESSESEYATISNETLPVFNSSETESSEPESPEFEYPKNSNETNSTKAGNETETRHENNRISSTNSVLMNKISTLISPNKTTNQEKKKVIRLEPSISGLINAAISDKADHLLHELRKSNQKGETYF